MDELAKLKLQLGIKDDKQDDLLELFLADAESFLRLQVDLHDEQELPLQLQPIVRGAAVNRYNRLNNEGMNSYSQDGESITFSKTDFDAYADEIKAYKQSHQGNYTTIIEAVNPYAL
ncbi:phage head-tail connector protein [Lactobacillus kitasatonis]|uniref:phage head-tail connector protein n=1 Tax=Lactobacillus kitasatonis TaxID=237446 RepID=UPI003F665CCC